MDVARYRNCHNLVLVDTFSSWADCKIIPNLSSDAVIISFKNTFKYVGIPVMLVSDNRTNFASREFCVFVREYRIQHVLTPPHHQSNGCAERLIQTMKPILRKNEGEKETMGDLRQLYTD